MMRGRSSWRRLWGHHTTCVMFNGMEGMCPKAISNILLLILLLEPPIPLLMPKTELLLHLQAGPMIPNGIMSLIVPQRMFAKLGMCAPSMTSSWSIGGGNFLPSQLGFRLVVAKRWVDLLDGTLLHADEDIMHRLQATFSTAPSTPWPSHHCWQAHRSNILQGLHQVCIHYHGFHAPLKTPCSCVQPLCPQALYVLHH